MDKSNITDIDLTELKILAVDDQREARLLLKQMLANLEVTQIYEASTGREALMFLDEAFDLIDMIICDWNMPEMDGISLLKQLRSVDMDTPFLMVTGRGDKASVIEAKGSGVSAYIKKPFSPDQLEAKIRILYARFLKTKTEAVA